ncbi:class I SAM-dependent methyltransferase [Sphingobium subterraneum]|uniref:SAM-dependent methyltransferase n=1 Tax=Sphingobium subterraneum TaxID=627688 RepID=A0A841J379_9SPHN|nr:class I SAM-dependent methyltransferase [Sphingobium subterraneum]MBB6125267.1 SAM-dependent methyltransferase [Sphingobium subterraneum]
MDAAIYDRMTKIDETHWWFRARRRIIATLLDRYAPARRPLQLLEVGCGTGSNIRLLQRYGVVEALEPNDGAREFSSHRTGIDIKSGFLPDGVDLEDDRYDLIALLDVLEHIPEDAGTLMLLRKKLSLGGVLLITVPAIPWLWSKHDVAHHHQRRYTERSLRSVLDGAGFEVEHLTHFNSLLLPIIVATRAIGKLTKRTGGDDNVPPPPVNAMLERVFGFERYWAARFRFPFGVSLAAVARRRDD